jgi:hypothetical protein
VPYFIGHPGRSDGSYVARFSAQNRQSTSHDRESFVETFCQDMPDLRDQPWCYAGFLPPESLGCGAYELTERCDSDNLAEYTFARLQYDITTQPFVLYAWATPRYRIVHRNGSTAEQFLHCFNIHSRMVLSRNSAEVAPVVGHVAVLPAMLHTLPVLIACHGL